MPNFSLKGLMFTITKRVAEDKDSRAGFCRTVYVMGWLTKILKGLSLGDKYSRKHHRRYEDEEIWECPPTTAHLESVIKSKIPSITSLINKGIDEMESELDRLGRPIAVDAGSVATFFSHVMSAIGGNTAGPGDVVVNVYINFEKKFAFVEMRSVEEASNTMALDGIIFE